MSEIPRRRTPTVWVGSVPVGSEHPIIVQSMTNTDTADAEATADQIAHLVEAGSELVRVTVDRRSAAERVPEVLDRLAARGVEVPLIGDFHYNGHVLLSSFPECARRLAKYRINPGNVGAGERRDENFAAIVRIALENDKPVRIGVNWGSLDPELLTRRMEENARRTRPKEARQVVVDAMVESALRSAETAEGLGLAHDRLVLSVKMSGVQDLLEAYEALAERTDLPLHVGLTEAGLGAEAIVKTTAALALLLQRGIGDTIRASLTPSPSGDRTEEVRLCRRILQALGLRHFAPQVTACPGCGRTASALFQRMAEEIEAYLQRAMPHWRSRYPGVEELRVAVMGCVVNGPGESRHADVGISLPGSGEAPKAPVFVEGVKRTTLQGEGMVKEFLRILEEYVQRRWGEEADTNADTPTEGARAAD